MIGADIMAMLEPLERFEKLRRKAVRLGDRLCDLSYANPYDGAQERATQALRSVLDDDSRALGLQYSPFGGQTLMRRAVAEALATSHGLAVDFRDVVLTPGAMSALQLALYAVGQRGDEVVVPVPCWLDYPVYVGHVGKTTVTVPLGQDDFSLDVDALAAAITERTCAVLMSHPSNPTGRSYDPPALRRLGEALAEAERRTGRPITLIADETHRDFTADYTSLASCFDRTLIVYSFGKYHLLQGQRLGYIATSSRHPEREQVADELVRWTRITGFATPTALMQRAIPKLLALRYDQQWVSYWRGRVCEELSAAGYRVVQPDATLFIYVQTPGGRDDFAFITQLASKGVLALPAPVFHHQGYFRLSLTGSQRMLEQALVVLKDVAS